LFINLPTLFILFINLPTLFIVFINLPTLFIVFINHKENTNPSTNGCKDESNIILYGHKCPNYRGTIDCGRLMLYHLQCRYTQCGSARD
jgi:hypothetical protein